MSTIFVKAGSSMTTLGTPEFVHALFSTISVNLEAGGWGSRFPMLLNELYDGRLGKASAPAALAELHKIRTELSTMPLARVIWDVEDRSKQPPWGDTLSADITSLANYFITNDGGDAFGALIENIEYLIEEPTLDSIELVTL